uniref:Photosystem I assembly protein Ycf4 n=1 Tax=Spyridia filamentosa TaxID=196632 RepID=A0A1Z1MK96_SPYFI|nr:photosystem I assembly protein [Spyridia filamentosa]ARW66184.1 photosystem I assembly protein [Spyridia filamentosa]
MSSNIRTDKIMGSRRLSNYWWATIVLLGGLGFSIAGLSSYLEKNLIPFIKGQALIFLPQGAVMLFYGIIGIFVSCFLWYTILLNIGGGYNKFDSIQKSVTIFRLGFPGRNRELKFKYKFNEILAIKIYIQEGLNPKRELYLKTKDQREIPISEIRGPLSVLEIEKQASTLAKFLCVNVEGIEY